MTPDEGLRMNPSDIASNSLAAADLGFDPDRLQRIRTRVERDIEAGRYDGARILAARRGTPVLDLTLGHADRASGRPLAADSVFSIMSISKVMTAVALMQCVERGDLSLLTPVSALIPEFAQRGKGLVTVGQVLKHMAGLGMGQAPMPLDELGTLSKSIAVICAQALESTPGEQVSYSAMMGYTVLGEIIRRLDAKGRTLRQIMREDVFQPLGMVDTSFGLSPAIGERRVPVVVRDTDSPELNPAFQTARDKAAREDSELPSGGATFSTAQDVLRFAEALRNGGALGDQRVLSPATVHLMTRNHTGSMPNSMMNSSRALHGMPAFPAFLGLGVFLRGEGLFPSHMPSLASPGTFGGWGLGSMGFWVDPERELSFVMLTSGLMERIRNLLRFQGIGDMLLASLVRP
jgi:CubicO group peptidase (beta-lactamase class C family)